MNLIWLTQLTQLTKLTQFDRRMKSSTYSFAVFPLQEAMEIQVRHQQVIHVISQHPT